jgi:hypothetical protein
MHGHGFERAIVELLIIGVVIAIAAFAYFAGRGEGSDTKPPKDSG